MPAIINLKSGLRMLIAAAGAAIALSVSVPVNAAPINVALGKSVTITGEVGVIVGCCWGDATVYPPASLASLVDGVFRPEGTQWQDGTVWWDERHPGSANNIIEIDLGGLFLISSLSIQADNNEFYDIAVRNRFGVWAPFATATSTSGAGMRTRAGGFAPFEATAFRIDARDGDEFYSVSEFQAVGVAIPEPGTLALLGLSLAGLAAMRRRKQ